MELKVGVGYFTLWILVISRLSTQKHIPDDDNINNKPNSPSNYTRSIKSKPILVQRTEDLRFKVKPVISLMLKNLTKGERINVSADLHFGSNKLTFPRQNHGSRRSSYITYVTGKPGVREKPLHKETNNMSFNTKSRNEPSEAAPEEVPYAVLLLRCDPDANCDESCSGTLISLEWVLTSDYIIALVDKGVYVIRIYAGGNYESEVLGGDHAPGSQVRLSTTYHYSSENHFGLAKADKRFSETDTVRPISLANKKWQWTDESSRRSGPFNMGITTDCTVTYFTLVRGKSVMLRRDFMRTTRSMKAGLGCTCQFDDGHIGPSQFLCSAWGESNFCSITRGAGLICDGSLRGVLNSIVQTDYDALSCLINEKITDNCEKFTNDYKYSRSSTFLFDYTWKSRVWINSYTNIFPTTTKTNPTNPTTEMDENIYDFLNSCSTITNITITILVIGFTACYII